MNWTRYGIVATKAKTGEVIAGTTSWDGLSSLFTVTTREGETKYVSMLDDYTLTPLGEEA